MALSPAHSRAVLLAIHSPCRPAAADVKDAVRLCAGAAMSQALGQPVSSSASLTLTLTVTHAPSAPEAAWLAPPAGRAQQGGGKKGGGRGRGGGRGWWGGRGPAGGTAAVGGAEEAAEPPWASTSLARRLEEMTQAAFLERCPASAAQLRQPASAAGATAGSATELQVQLTCSRKPFYVGGRWGCLLRLHFPPWLRAEPCRRQGLAWSPNRAIP